ncbi:MAG: thiamine phosphate synthase [Desulfovibrionaceae bacterium]|nr:thiamine phosphate synthase [Desulfovibrionaceae bacterium]
MKTMREALDISAYLVVGPENTQGRPVRDIVRAALRAEFTCVQIRSKEASAREMIDLLRGAAEEIAAAGASERVALLADDRLDVVLAARNLGVKVDGVHVGQSDIPPEICRAYLGQAAVVGLSARTDELISYVRDTDTGAIDYFGAGPLHETATKPDCGRDAQGNIITRSFAELEELAASSPIPVVVGGGVKVSDIPNLAKTGVAGFFVVSAVAGAPDPEKAAAELVAAWRKNREHNS